MERRKILDGIKGQIVSFDNKASILLTVIGFIIAFTTNFVSLLDPYKGTSAIPLDFKYYVIVIILTIYFF